MCKTYPKRGMILLLKPEGHWTQSSGVKRPITGLLAYSTSINHLTPARVMAINCHLLFTKQQY